MDADAICKANPGLTADNFQSGKVIRIPASNRPAAATAAKPAVPVRPKCKETYKVKRKETIYSISQKFGLSETELRDANPEMKAPDYQLRKGDLICIPYPATGQPKPVLTPVNPEAPSNAELLARKSTPAPKRYIRMGVILPLKGNTPEHKKMIEFYRGVLMAVEDIKKTGVSVDVFTYDAGQSAADMKAVLSRNALTELDFIIGPLRAEQIPALSGFCQKSKTRLVVPFSSQGDEMYQNPYYYAVNPPKSFLFSEAAHLTTELEASYTFDHRSSRTAGTAGYKLHQYRANWKATFFIAHNWEVDTRVDWTCRQGMQMGDADGHECVWNLGLAYKFLKQQATVRLQAFDLLRSQKNYYTSFGNNTWQETRMRGKTEYVLLTFAYRFNKM